MQTFRPTSRGLRVPPEVIIGSVIGLTALGWYIKDRPFVVDPIAESVQVAVAEPPNATSPVLVVLPAIAEATTLETFSWDAMWLNAVEQEIGQARSVAASDLSRADMDPCAWVIIPRHASLQIDPTQAQFVHTWVEDGGVLLLEQPEGPWQLFTGQSLTGARRSETRRITGFDGAVVRGELREDLVSMPLRSTLLAYNPADLARGRDYDVLLEIDGQPGIIRRSLGRGQVIVLLFDAAQALGLMQQGVPQDDLSLQVPEGIPLPPGLSSVTSLVSNPGLNTSSVPYADLLERNLLYLLDEQRPVGRLWLYPGRYRGALLVSHSEAGFGERLRFMTDWEHASDQRSTTFLVAGSLPPESLAEISRTGADVQVQWVPTEAPFAPTRAWGIGGFRPLRRPMTLAEQTVQLTADLSPYGPPRISRAVDGVWPVEWLDGFRRLEALGIVADTSYGPAPPALTAGEPSVGYLFGTGYPFRPVDASGYRFRVMELPTHALDASEGYTIQAIRRLLIDAAEGHHTTIVGDWRPDTMAVRPSFDALEGWRSAFALAATQELWVTTHAEYFDFMQRRAGSTVRSSFQREQRTLSMELTVVGPGPGIESPADLTPAAAFPARFEGRQVERVMLDGAPLELASLAVTGDRALYLVPLEPGEHRIQVFYPAPTETILSPDVPENAVPLEDGDDAEGDAEETQEP